MMQFSIAYNKNVLLITTTTSIFKNNALIISRISLTTNSEMFTLLWEAVSTRKRQATMCWSQTKTAN